MPALLFYDVEKLYYSNLSWFAGQSFQIISAAEYLL